jgi:hypothetical protein
MRRQQPASANRYPRRVCGVVWCGVVALGGMLTFTGRQTHTQVVLATPFLATDWGSTRQRVLARMSAAAPVLGAVAGAVGKLPSWLQDRLLAVAQPRAEPHARQCMKQLMSSAGVCNNFHLARHEFRCVCSTRAGPGLTGLALCAGTRCSTPLKGPGTHPTHLTHSFSTLWLNLEVWESG